MRPEPSALRILSYPATELRRKAEPVERFDAWLEEVVQRMMELMEEAEGVGLAAPQVGLSLRLFVVDPEEGGTEHSVYINPRLHDHAGDLVAKEEGCLSLPGIRAGIRRPPRVSITALDLRGTSFTAAGDGLLARVWQHEHDHLEGTLILDRMTPMDRIATRRAVKELMSSGAKR
jgi:peptide deformylase